MGINNRGYDSNVQTSSGVKLLRQIAVPYARCPSDAAADRTDWSISNYSGSMGSQRVDSSNASCNPYSTQQVLGVGNYEDLGPGGNCNNGDCGDPTPQRNISGIFSYRGPDLMSFASILDGTSNVIMIGEVLPSCVIDSFTFGSDQCAIGSTVCPINIMAPCDPTTNVALSKNHAYSACTQAADLNTVRNLAWAFKSLHPQGAQFVYADGSVHFLMQQMNYATYQRLGGRRDGLALDSINP